ncbi:MAG TPA: hypothetical protein DCP92_08525 [Nitrospiraceae bacterium]|jgi:hypothetical protein|nr:hypothetical protein [Nitrospiraceae bacterium]
MQQDLLCLLKGPEKTHRALRGDKDALALALKDIRSYKMSLYAWPKLTRHHRQEETASAHFSKDSEAWSEAEICKTAFTRLCFIVHL